MQYHSDRGSHSNRSEIKTEKFQKDRVFIQASETPKDCTEKIYTKLKACAEVS